MTKPSFPFRLSPNAEVELYECETWPVPPLSRARKIPVCRQSSFLTKMDQGQKEPVKQKTAAGRARKPKGHAGKGDPKQLESRTKSEQESSLLHLDELPVVAYTCEAHGIFVATYVSGNVEGFTGYKPEDFVDDPSFWSRNIHPEDAPAVFNGLSKLFEKGRLMERLFNVSARGETLPRPSD